MQTAPTMVTHVSWVINFKIYRVTGLDFLFNSLLYLEYVKEWNCLADQSKLLHKLTLKLAEMEVK